MNPFDDPDGRFHVLRNEAGEYSLWPEFAEIPGGWTVVLAGAGRRECLEHVEAVWSGPLPAAPAG